MTQEFKLDLLSLYVVMYVFYRPEHALILVLVVPYISLNY